MGVTDGVCVTVGVRVCVAVYVTVGVFVSVGVDVIVGVWDGEAVTLGINEGLSVGVGSCSEEENCELQPIKVSVTNNTDPATNRRDLIRSKNCTAIKVRREYVSDMRAIIFNNLF